MGSKHAASGSTSSAVAPARESSHIKRRSGGGRASVSGHTPVNAACGAGDSSLFGLDVYKPRPSRSPAAPPSTSKSFTSSSSIRRASSPTSEAVEEWSSVFTQKDSGKGDRIAQESHSVTSSGRGSPIRTSDSLHSSRKEPSSQHFTAKRWTPEGPNLPALFTEDAYLPNNLYEHDKFAASPFRLHPASPGMYRSSSSSSSFYRSESLPIIASTSQSPYLPASLSPSISFDSLSPSRNSIDSRRNSDTTLSIAPSPPMPSSSFQPHHLSSPNSLTNRTSPKTGPHIRRDDDMGFSARVTQIATTSSFFPSARRRASGDLARDLSDEPRTTTTTRKECTRQARWKAFSWKARKRSPSDEGDAVPDQAWQRTIVRASQLSDTLAVICLGPFHQLVFSQDSKPIVKGPTKPSSVPTRTISPKPPYKRWRNRILRLALALYIFYSLLLFTSHLFSLPHSLSSPNENLPRHRQHSQLHARSDVLDYTKWQQARFKLLDVYNSAAEVIEATALRFGKQSSKEAAGDFAGDSIGSNSLNNLMLLDELPEVKRRWGDSSKRLLRVSGLVAHFAYARLIIANNPLTSLSTEYRFSKMFSKLDAAAQEQIEPFLFRAEAAGQAGDITACLYFNDAWISELPSFMERWQGPVSLVYELGETRSSPERDALIAQLHALRNTHPLIRNLVDVHVVYNSPQSDLQAKRLRERFILRPVASNFQLNLARFFAKTDMVWLVADARILPAPGLRQRLNELEEVRTYTMEYADAIIIPIFGPTRAKTANSTALPLLAGVREGIGLAARQEGVAKQDFQLLSRAYVTAHYESIPLHRSHWPVKKESLLALASDSPPASMLPEHLREAESPVFTLFDRRWEAGEGPTSFTQWREARYTPIQARRTASKDKADIRSDSGFYQVTDYDVHYAPSLVIGRERQPWCTEKFEYNRAACIYQMYLQGAKKWVLPDSWAYTLEQTNKHAPKEPKNDAEKLKNAIQNRLYTKFHSEACMHYGRAFLSNDMWDSERAQHLRYSCAKVLSSYGIGLSEEEEAAAASLEQQQKKRKQKQKQKKKKA